MKQYRIIYENNHSRPIVITKFHDKDLPYYEKAIKDWNKIKTISCELFIGKSENNLHKLIATNNCSLSDFWDIFNKYKNTMEGIKMNDNNGLNERVKEVEEKWWETHDKHSHFERFEHQIRNLLAEVTPEADIVDVFKYAQMIHSLFVFSVKDKFNETNKIFLENTKSDFYNFIENYHTKFHRDITFLKKFADFYIF